MSAFYVDPIFTLGQAWGFAGLLAFSLALTFVFSPRRRAMLGAPMFLLASGLQAAPALAGVTIVRGATRLVEYHLADDKAYRARSRTIASRTRIAWPGRSLRAADKAIWKDRLGRWFGSAR